MQYATPDDLTTYAASVGANVACSADKAAGWLTAASRLVRRATANAWYDVDTNGYPTDAVKLQAMNDATCAQALAWATLDVNASAGGVATSSKAVTSVGIGSARKNFSDAQAVADARAATTTDLVPDAVEILREACLITTRAWSYG